MSKNYTETENNGTHIIIKQVFLNIDPDVYVTWDGFYLTIMYWIFWYMIISVLVNTCKRKGLCGCKSKEPATVAIIADPENVRVVNTSEE
tara:strand:- start:208 stop:477 length:270 start_codon:yes stop_codon:yes gene_type:complete